LAGLQEACLQMVSVRQAPQNEVW